jgi:hypothetical protein
MTSSNDSVVLYGGQGDVLASLELPAEDMPYLMLETAEYGIQFGETSEYTYHSDWDVLRLHVFGEGGDLMIRCDELRTFWRFVGDQSVFDKIGLANGTPYPEPLSVSEEDERSLLWGAYNQELRSWQEDRVGKGRLKYPFPEGVERVEIRARRVFDKSETVAYWTYTLVAHQPQESK